MKTRLLLIFLLIFLLATTLLLTAWQLYDWLHVPTLTGIVIAVADGDTVTLQTADHPKLKIRLAEIDAPETRQPYGDIIRPRGTSQDRATWLMGLARRATDSTVGLATS